MPMAAFRLLHPETGLGQGDPRFAPLLRVLAGTAGQASPPHPSAPRSDVPARSMPAAGTAAGCCGSGPAGHQLEPWKRKNRFKEQPRRVFPSPRSPGGAWGRARMGVSYPQLAPRHPGTTAVPMLLLAGGEDEMGMGGRGSARCSYWGGAGPAQPASTAASRHGRASPRCRSIMLPGSR